jgi:hypothetical protein
MIEGPGGMIRLVKRSQKLEARRQEQEVLIRQDVGYRLHVSVVASFYKNKNVFWLLTPGFLLLD